jgi:hypothetical protein
MRAQMALCPIAEPLPKALSEDGRLKTEAHISDELGRHVGVTGQSELLISPVYRLVGTSFNNSYYDTNFWTSGGTNGGSVIFDGDALISTSTNAAGSASLSSVRSARFVPGSANLFRGSARLTTPPIADNLRRFGAYDNADGFFFQVSGTTFGVGYRKNSGDTIVENGSFNGNLGEQVAIDTSVFNLSIEYGTNSVVWYLNGEFLHKINVSTETLVETLTLPIKTDSVNVG